MTICKFETLCFFYPTATMYVSFPNAPPLSARSFVTHFPSNVSSTIRRTGPGAAKDDIHLWDSVYIPNRTINKYKKRNPVDLY